MDEITLKFLSFAFWIEIVSETSVNKIIRFSVDNGGR